MIEDPMLKFMSFGFYPHAGNLLVTIFPGGLGSFRKHQLLFFRQNVARTSLTHSAVPCVPRFCSHHILTPSVIYY